MFKINTRKQNESGLSRTRRIVLGLAVAVAALAGASTAQASALTLSVSGSPGPWLGSYGLSGDIYCTSPSGTAPGWFQVQRQEIGRSPRYPAYAQDIWMQARLQWSSDAITWSNYQTKPWQQQRVGTLYSDYALFAQESFNLASYRGLYFRTRVEFRWYVAGTSTWLGTAVDSYTASGITVNFGARRYTYNPTGEGVCQP